MISFNAQYFDGNSSARHAVKLQLQDDGTVRISGDGIDLAYPLSAFSVASRIGNTRRSLRLPDGALCETDDNDAVDRMFAQRQAGSFHSWLHHWESRGRYAVVALALTVIAVWVAIQFGIPAVARQVALGLPAATEAAIGKNALAGLDQFVFKSSQLPRARRTELQALFAEITGNLEPGRSSRLEFRMGEKLGPNALALPSGIVVITDELVKLAGRDEELAAVLAHEIGHLKYRHALRHLLQDSATSLLLVFVTGDVSSILGAIPAGLLLTKYSRDFEREADDFALQYLDRRGIDSKAFSDILLRMDKERPGSRDIPSFLSTHPSTEERARRSQQKP